MNRYNIKIDGEVMPNSYTYEELVLNGILEFDDIEVKKETKSNYTKIKSYYFPEEHEGADSGTTIFLIDDKGQAHFKNSQIQKKRKKSKYIINEFGEMVRQGGDSSSHSSTQGHRSPSTPTNYSSSSSDNNTGWKVFLTIVAIIIFIAITFSTTGWGSLPAGPIGYFVLRAIWSDNK